MGRRVTGSHSGALKGARANIHRNSRVQTLEISYRQGAGTPGLGTLWITLELFREVVAFPNTD